MQLLPLRQACSPYSAVTGQAGLLGALPRLADEPGFCSNRPGCQRAGWLRANYPAEVPCEILVGEEETDAPL